ncbi:MAG: hypothetical protein H6838_06025 [Planctomycetes bacterium]|nr:hypothetical protein [Planctomycetota bacterium]MCB9885029.1 hypothetical protein [Planctomycetota bacterium]
MLPKLCTLLAVAVLLAALLCGNPFLPPRPAPGAQDVGVPRPSRFAPPVERVERADADICPDATLREAVVRVLHAADGSPRWVLEDGRVLHVAADGGLQFDEDLDVSQPAGTGNLLEAVGGR